MIKKLTPSRPVLYRSHIQIRTDLVATPGSPQADIWAFLWDNIQHADMFISHPIPYFVPHNVPREKVAYLPATSDWLDGLNKPLNKWDTLYYSHVYNTAAHGQRATELNFPARKYIAQVRFNPTAHCCVLLLPLPHAPPPSPPPAAAGVLYQPPKPPC